MPLPIDRDRPFKKSDYPSNPGAYTPLIHFLQQKRQERRYLTDEVVESCITDGDLRDNNDGTACFRLVWGQGVAYYLITGFHRKGYRVTITGWPHLHDRDAALNSGRWSSEELDQIEKLNDETRDDFAVQYPTYNRWIQAND
jgi:hypothetical protein